MRNVASRSRGRVRAEARVGVKVGRCAICTVGIAALLVGAVRPARTVALIAPPETDRHVSDYTTNVADITAQIHVTQSDTKEMAKIGSDFSTTYSLRNMYLLYKQPDKLRLEGKSVTRGTALMILNGPNRFVDIPRFKIHLVENLEKSPTRRQSLLELGGVISPDTLKFMSGKFVRTEMLEGRATDVFDMRYTGAESGQYYRVWLDSITHTTAKREWYNSENQLRATFVYDQPKEVSAGVWLPTRVQIKNAEGVVAVELTVEDIKVNQGLVDGLFAIPS